MASIAPAMQNDMMASPAKAQASDTGYLLWEIVFFMQLSLKG
ncbi:hypothetical protein [Scandinavium goeteborgense]|nr:hypothetical protein [Scandinavium goeteborgense]